MNFRNVLAILCICFFLCESIKAQNAMEAAEVKFCAFDLLGTNDKEFVLFEESGHSPMRNEGKALTEEMKMFIELYK